MYNMVTGSIVTYNNISTIAKTLETLFDETQNVDFKLYVVTTVHRTVLRNILRRIFLRFRLSEAKKMSASAQVTT